MKGRTEQIFVNAFCTRQFFVDWNKTYLSYENANYVTQRDCTISINSLKSQTRYIEIQTEYQISRELIFPVMCT